MFLFVSLLLVKDSYSTVVRTLSATALGYVTSTSPLRPLVRCLAEPWRNPGSGTGSTWWRLPQWIQLLSTNVGTPPVLYCSVNQPTLALTPTACPRCDGQSRKQRHTKRMKGIKTTTTTLLTYTTNTQDVYTQKHIMLIKIKLRWNSFII